MEKLNILLYKRAKKLYCYIANIRMNFYLVIGNKKKASKIITEHFNW